MADDDLIDATTTELDDNDEFETDIIPDINFVDKKDVYIYQYKTSRPVLSKYEYTALIGFRAQQIANNAKPFIKVEDGMSPIDIAEEEFKQLKDKFPFYIKRPLPKDNKNHVYEICDPAFMFKK